MRKINLLILLKSIDGGTGTYLDGLTNLKKIFSPRQLNISVLVLEKPSYRKVSANEYIYFSKTKYTPERYTLTFGRIKLLLKELMWFKKQVNLFNPDIVISEDSHSIIISELNRFIFRQKYKTVNTIHNHLDKVIDHRLHSFTHPVFKLFLSFILNSSDQVISVSKKLSQDIFKNFNLRKLPQTIPFLFSKEIKVVKHKKNTPQKNILISVARLDSQKDHKTLLEAFQQVAIKFTNLELWLVGDGPLKNELTILTKKLNINNKVKFLGWSQDVNKILDKSDIFILSTHWEGYPLTVVEAMARGLPVIVTDCKYGPSEILDNGKYGLLIKDKETLTGAILKLVSNKKEFEKYSDLSYKRAKDILSEDMGYKYKKLLLSLLGD